MFVYGFPGMTMNERSPVATIALGLLNRVTDFFDNVATPPPRRKAPAQRADLRRVVRVSHLSALGLGHPGSTPGEPLDEERQVSPTPPRPAPRGRRQPRLQLPGTACADLIRQAMVSVNARIP